MSVRDSAPVLDRQRDAAMIASRVFVAIVASSIDGAESLVNIRQLRALVTLVEQGPMNVATLAERIHVHPSNATRLCDQLVETALINRDQSVRDRRHLVLTANTKGRRLVSKMM